jgi:sporulation protein YlmC with PRC-barrel domain
VRFSRLDGLEVTTESGERLGRVYDLRGELTARTLRVTGLVIGELGLLERLGIGAPTSAARIRTHDVIAWRDVVRADRRGVIVREGAEPRKA